MRKKDLIHLPKRQREEVEKLIPVVEKIINEWDCVGLFPEAPENEYEKEIVSIAYHLGLLGGSRLDFLRVSQVIYIEMAHGFTIMEIDEKMCLEPAKKLVEELGK